MPGAGGELVGDGPGVAGQSGRVVVDLVEEELQGAAAAVLNCLPQICKPPSMLTRSAGTASR
jgi:hypothetical protein